MKQQQQPQNIHCSYLLNCTGFGMFTASQMYRLMAGGTRPISDSEPAVGEENKSGEKTAAGLFSEDAMAWIAETASEWITGARQKHSTDCNTDWSLAHTQEALLFFEQVTGKEVKHFTGANYRFFPYQSLAGCSPDAILVNENAIVVVKCPATAANHSHLLRITTKTQSWLKAKIKAERQAWLKANRYEHYVQSQFEMMCTGAKKCYCISYDPRLTDHHRRMAVIELLPDNPMQQDIAERTTCATALLKQQLSLPH